MNKAKLGEVFSKSKHFLAKNSWIFILILVLIIAFSAYIRTTNIPQLKDVTTGNYTLGPDLDPFLYLRLAHELVDTGKLHDPDMMRQAPIGALPYKNLMIPSIVLIYRILDIFFSPPIASVEFAAIIAPVIFVSLTLIVFYLFIINVFSFAGKIQAKIIGVITTALYVVMPEMLHRTTAGIPEIESLGMLWFWLSFLFITLAWKSEKFEKMAIFAAIAGISTRLMIYTWGGFRYIFMSLALASLLMFFFEKQKKKNFLIYFSWFIPILIISLLSGTTPGAFISSLPDTGFASIVAALFLFDIILVRLTGKISAKIKLPQSAVSIILALAIAVVAAIIINPGFITTIFSKIIEGLLYPFGRGRVGLTVAENRAPYFVEVIGSFSKYLFWLFFAGTILIFYKMISHFDKKNKLALNAFFIISISGLIFSRISPESLLNGENFISSLLYFGGLLAFIFAAGYIYLKAYRKNDEKTLSDFRNIEFSYLFLIAFIFWMIISMRGAIRLFFIISPAIIIAAAYLPVALYNYAKNSKDELKIILWVCVLITICLLIFTFVNFEKTTAHYAKSTVPGVSTYQWQYAMQWVRENTPENSVFVHWWDYGYWVQTMGKRATVTDGGHANDFWDHTTARYLMTAQSEKTALQLCKAHNVSYFLIDPTDIGKYSAFSKIGSDENDDRFSWISSFSLSDTQEKRNETVYVFKGGSVLDEDLIWKGQIYPRGEAGIGAILLPIQTSGNNSGTLGQPSAILVYQGKQETIPIKCIYIEGKRIDFDKGIEGCFYVIPSISSGKVLKLGSGFWLSEKLMNSLMVKLYILNESTNFELAHSEEDPIIAEFNTKYNLNLPEMVYYDQAGFLGPIKIWKVNYPEDIEYHKEYLQQIPAAGNWAILDYLGV